MVIGVAELLSKLSSLRSTVHCRIRKARQCQIADHFAQQLLVSLLHLGIFRGSILSTSHILVQPISRFEQFWALQLPLPRQTTEAYGLPATTSIYGLPEELTDDPEVDLLVVGVKIPIRREVMLPIAR